VVKPKRYYFVIKGSVNSCHAPVSKKGMGVRILTVDQCIGLSSYLELSFPFSLALKEGYSSTIVVSPYLVNAITRFVQSNGFAAIPIRGTRVN
jgi:hypothetical protein